MSHMSNVLQRIWPRRFLLLRNLPVRSQLLMFFTLRQKHVTRPKLASLTTNLRASFAVFAESVIHAMSEDHAAAARKRDSNFAPVRREQISEVCSGADQRQSERCCPEHTFPLMSPVPKANRCRSYDGHEDREQSVSMFFRGDEMGRDGRQREDHRGRDAMNKTERRSDHPYSVNVFRP
jgi:hypothetical protein